MEYLELKREQSRLRTELRRVTQEVCEMETGHTLKFYAEWSSSGQECGKCGKRFAENCHYVDCKCRLKHRE